MDLLSPQDVANFRGVIRDICDTFHQYPVIVRQESGDVPLLGGLQGGKLDNESGKDGELTVVDDVRNEVGEWKTIRFNKDALDSSGITISHDDRVVVDGDEYVVMTIHEAAYFRNSGLIVSVEVAR